MRRLSLSSLFLVGLLLLFTAGVARAEDPPYVGWSALLPGLTTVRPGGRAASTR